MDNESQLPLDVEMTFEERKNALLKRLLSKNSSYKYRRHVTSTLRYAGGKSLAVGFIAELLPNNLSKVVSPFFGGGSVEFSLSRDLGVEVVGYDIFDILVNFWQVQISEPEKLASELAKYPPTKEHYLSVRKKLKAHWDKLEIITDPIDLAATYYFNHNTSYGPHFLGHPSGVYLNEKRFNTLLQKVSDFKPGRVTVQLDSFEQSIPRHKGTFIYADPPYYLDGDSKTFVGMYPHRNFPVHHKGFDHEKLRDLLHDHKGGFILSYNDCETIRDWYSGFNMSSPEWQYTFSQGDTRIGENRLRDSGGSHIKKSHELLIWGGF